MYRSFLQSFAMAAALVANAQQTVHQVMVLNEGYYNFNTQTQDVPVTLGSFDPQSGIYQTVATISDARFGNYVAVENEIVYVSADHRLLKYDANTFALLDEADVPGIRRFAIWQDQLVITLGEVGGLPHYCEVRDKNTLDLLYSIDTATLPYSCEGVQIVGDEAYIAVNNGFEWGNTVGQVGVLDLAAGQWETSIDLGPDGLNPENIMVVDGTVYTFNNKDFAGGSISKVDPSSASLTYTHDVALSSGCGSSAPAQNRIYFMEYAQNVLNRYDLSSDAVLDTLAGSPATYGLIENPIDQVMYGTTTDFVSSGELHVMSYQGQILSSVAVGVSPGKLALDVRSSNAVAEIADVPTLQVYPNPAQNEIFISAANGDRLTINDATGREVMNAANGTVNAMRVDVSALSKGLYLVRCGTNAAARFVKQ